MANNSQMRFFFQMLQTEKMSSDDESKENNPDAMTVDDNTNDTEDKTSTPNLPLPLNINCDNVLDDSTKHSSPLQ